MVTEVPPTTQHLGGHGAMAASPSGFSPRLYRFLAAVAERRPLDLMGVHRDHRDLARPFFQPDLAVQRYLPVLAALPGAGRPGLAGRVSAWRQFLVGTLPYTCQPRRLGALESRLATDPPGLVVLYLPHLAHLVSRIPRGIPVVCALEEGWERFEALSVDQRPIGRWRRAWINTTEGRRAARLYRRVAARASAVVLISDREREWFAQWIPRQRIVVIPHGVDCEFFQPMAAGPEDIDVAVFGLLFHERNAGPAADAWRAGQAGVGAGWRWGFVGPASDHLTETVASPRSLVTGYVADVRPWYARSKVVLAPAVTGTGVKTTVLQAWAMGRAVVSTPFSLAGLPARPGENVLVGETPDALIEQVGRLLASPELRSRLADAGRATVIESRDIRLLAGRFADVCERAIVESPAAVTAPRLPSMPAPPG